MPDRWREPPGGRREKQCLTHRIPQKKSVHECERLGLRPVYRDTFNMDAYGDDLRAVIAHEAVVRVMFGVHRLSFGLSHKIDSIAKENMPAEAFEEYRLYAGILTDLENNKLEILEEVVDKIMVDFPSMIGTLEAMLSGALVQSGLCCDSAADELVAGWLPHRISDLPGYQKEWATI